MDRPFIVHVETSSGEADPERKAEPVSALQWLAENAVEDELPCDLSAQHDHYLRNRQAGLILLPHFFADTAFWIALFRARGQYHRNAIAWNKYLVRSQALVVTTEAV